MAYLGVDLEVAAPRRRRAQTELWLASEETLFDQFGGQLSLFDQGLCRTASAQVSSLHTEASKFGNKAALALWLGHARDNMHAKPLLRLSFSSSSSYSLEHPLWASHLQGQIVISCLLTLFRNTQLNSQYCNPPKLKQSKSKRSTRERDGVQFEVRRKGEQVVSGSILLVCWPR